jgi:hypothetical protein
MGMALAKQQQLLLAEQEMRFNGTSLNASRGGGNNNVVELDDQRLTSRGGGHSRPQQQSPASNHMIIAHRGDVSSPTSRQQTPNYESQSPQRKFL